MASHSGVAYPMDALYDEHTLVPPWLFEDREVLYDLLSTISGARLHPIQHTEHLAGTTTSRMMATPSLRMLLL